MHTLKFQSSVFAFLQVLSILSPALAKPTIKPKVKGRTVSIPVAPTPEAAISSAALRLGKTEFSKSPHLIQKYDKKGRNTLYFLPTHKLPTFQVKGSLDLGKKVIVIRDQKSAFSKPTWDFQTYTVLRLNETSRLEKSYFIFKAFISGATPQDRPDKIVLLKGTKNVVHWNTWQEPLISAKVGVHREFSDKSKVVIPQVPTFRKAPTAKKGTNVHPKGIPLTMKGRAFQNGTITNGTITNGTITNGTTNAEETETKEYEDKSEEIKDSEESPQAAGSGKSEEDFLALSSEEEEEKMVCTGRGCARVTIEDNVDRDDDGNPDYAGDGEKDFDVQRAKQQRQRWVNASKLSYQDIITSTAEVYAHVQWYRLSDYKGDTEITVNRSIGVINKFKGYAYGSCKARTIRPDVLRRAKITQNVVDFFVVILREYCKPDKVVAYNELFLSGLVSLNADHSVDIVKDTKLLRKKELEIAEMDEIQMVFMLSAYSQIYISLVNFPTEPLDPHYTQITSRVFLLVNTVLHIQDLLMKLAPQHFNVVMSDLLMKMKPMMKDVICEYLDIRARDLGVKKSLRSIALYSSVAMVVLLEHMAITLKDPGKFVGLDAHVAYQTYHKKTRKNHFKVIKGYRDNQELYKQCVTTRE